MPTCIAVLEYLNYAEVTCPSWPLGSGINDMGRKKIDDRFVMCVNNDGYPASLEARKVYKLLPDAQAEKRGFVRVIDESGEDYLFPDSLFVPIEVPTAALDVFSVAR